LVELETFHADAELQALQLMLLLDKFQQQRQANYTEAVHCLLHRLSSM
jgi:hypothetical protein